MIKRGLIPALVMAVGCASAWGAPRGSSPTQYRNALFAQTHLLPSPFTLPAGTFTYGSSLALGVTDFLQIGTDLYRTVFKIYNANLKISLVETYGFALALTGGFETYDASVILDVPSGSSITSYLPGAVMAFGLTQQLAWFIGGQMNFTNFSGFSAGAFSSGLVRGASVETDLSWAYNRGAQDLGTGNVLSIGASYDLTYKIYGVGLSHHWPGFHLGLHYYPNASTGKILPIIAGGGSMQF